MNFTGKVFGAALAASIAAAAPSAADATTITKVNVVPGAHTNYLKTLTYTVPSVLPKGVTSYLSVYLSSVQTGKNTNVDFSKTALTGTEVVTTKTIVKGKTVTTTKTVTSYAATPLKIVSTGVSELRETLRIPVIAGEKFSLAVTSTSQSVGLYTAQFVLGVPEPATWGLMILGFGAVAYSMRRRVAKTGRLAIA